MLKKISYHFDFTVNYKIFFKIVYLSFDDAFTALAEQNYYRELFNGTFTNPDGCAIRATHYISARSNNYALVKITMQKMFKLILS